MTYILLAIGVVAGLIALFLLWLLFVAYRTHKRVEKYLPPLGKSMKVEGGQIQYLDTGEGQPIIMIHGLNGQMRHFKYAIQERIDNDYRTIIIDRPGCGYSERDSDDRSRVTEQAKMIAEFIKKLDLKTKPLIVGHSLGGAVSLALALNHRDVVGGLALVAPATDLRPDFKNTSHIPPAFRSLVILSPLKRKLFAWTFAIPNAIKNSKTILANVFGPEAVPQDVATKGGGLLSLRPRGFYVASTDYIHSAIDLPGMIERYGELADLPFGIIYGTEDKILNYEKNGVLMKERVPHLELDLIEGAGHMIPMTKPDEVSSFIRKTAAKVFPSVADAAE